MSKGNTTEIDLLAKVFKATALPWDAVANLDIHFHTADPGEAGLSTTAEATYGAYALVSVPRNGTASGWSGTNPVANAALIQFPQCTSGSNVLTHLSITPTGSTQILYSGALNASLTVSAGIQPQFAIGAITISED
jgi:hypothetical protein